MTAPTAENPPDASADAEQEPHWRVARIEDRMTAAMLDGFLCAVLGFLLTIVIGPLVAAVGHYDLGDLPSEVTDRILAAGMWLAATLYIGLHEGSRGSTNGQTGGKRQVEIRTVRAHTGLPISRTRAWLRAAWIALLLPLGVPLAALVQPLLGGDLDVTDLNHVVLLPVGALTFGIAVALESQRALHDWIFDTAVVNAAITPRPAIARPGDAAAGLTIPDTRPGSGAQPLRPLPLIGRKPDLRGVAFAVLCGAVGVVGLIDQVTR